MNIMEETQGEHRIKITGLSIRQIKDIFENEYGALMWSGGGAYPCDGVTLQFKSTDGPAALPVGELTDDQIMNIRRFKLPMSAGDVDFARAVLSAARSQPTTEESLAVAGAQPVREPLSLEELELCRQWFNSVQDTNGGFLDPTDYVLAEKLYGILKIRVPSSITSVTNGITKKGGA